MIKARHLELKIDAASNYSQKQQFEVPKSIGETLIEIKRYGGYD